MIASVGVLGGGAWGTALALTAARAGRRTTLWARSIATVNAILQRRENPKYLPEIAFDAPVAATLQLADVAGADLLVVAVPAQSIRTVLRVVGRLAAQGTPVIIAAKGLERGTGRRMTEVAGEVAPNLTPAVLSGPSFAVDVARGLPTAVTIAAGDEALALELCGALGLEFNLMETSFFLSREKIVPVTGNAGGTGMALWRERMFAAMARNAGNITDYFNIPTNRVIELGTRVEI
jgi:glycerol-3-phosphate dehydrogenase (NAD(P)+)